MDNFRPIIIALLLICCIGFADTNYVHKKITDHKILALYKNKTKILGFGLEERGNYLSVKDVLKGTPAAKAGILNKDMIVSLNYVEVSNVDKFKKTFDDISTNEKIILGVIRDGESNVKYVSISPRVIRATY